ncbi:MAG TPA: DUF2092 domain-containing protein [Bdellovibrionota bacterium]
MKIQLSRSVKDAAVFLIGAALLGFAIPSLGNEESAVDIMKRACNAYSGQTSVQVRGLISVDTSYENDAKIQKNYVVDLSAKLPNKFRAEIQGDSHTGIYFDGTRVTVIDHDKKFFARRELAGNLNDFLAFADKMNLPTPLLDFINPKECEENLAKADVSERLSDLTIDGVRVRHLFFRNTAEKIDWETWVMERGSRAVVKKAVITSQYAGGGPQYELLLTRERLGGNLPDEQFSPKPPQLATEIKFLEEIDE